MSHSIRKWQYSLIVALLLGLMVIGLSISPRSVSAASCTTTLNAGDDIQTAVTAAAAGDVICLSAGTYNPAATIVVNKAITLQGPQFDVDPRPSVGAARTPGDASEAIIDGGGAISTIIQITSSNVVLNGFEVKSGAGDLIASPSGSNIADVRIAYLIIHDATLDEGMQIRDCEDCIIEYNHIYDTIGDGINLCCGSTGGLIQFNETTDIASENGAIYIYEAEHTTIQCNLIDGTTQNEGIKFGQKYGPDADKYGGDVLYNVIRNTAQDGIAVYISNANIIGNDISHSASENGAIYVTHGVSNVNIIYNNIHDNTFSTLKWQPGGVTIGNADGQSAATVIVNNNNFSGNIPNGVLNRASDQLNAENNWWGDASGPGPSGSGSGDGVSGPVDYDPWLTQPASIPAGPCVTGGVIEVRKVAEGGGETRFEFDPSWSDDNFFLSSGMSETSDPLPAGTYSVAEVNLPTVWSLDSATCDNTATQDVETVDPSTIPVADGDAWVCTFTNTRHGSITITKATDPAGGTGFPFVLDPGNFGILAKWGSAGADAGQFDNPNGVAVDGSGNVYVADSDNNRIQKFDADGAYLTQWGSGGAGNGQFAYPIGVAVDGSGNVYVADSGNNRIQKFDAGGTYQTQWGSGGAGNSQFSHPTGVAVDGSGNVYVADTSNHRIQKFGAGGAYLAQWGSVGVGNSQFDNPTDVAVDGDGNVYVVDAGNHRIQKFDGDGTYLTQWGSNGAGNSQFTHPFGVAIDGGGNVYVADTGNNRIQMFDSNGAYQTQWGSLGAGNGQFNYPLGVAVDGDSNVYVADTNNHRIQKFGPRVVTLDDGQSHTFASLPPGVYSVTETVPDGWKLDGAVCDIATTQEVESVDPSTIPVAIGDAWVCTFTNIYDPTGSITITKATDPAGGAGFPFVLDPGNFGFLAKWGSDGAGDGQFKYPIGVAVDGSGNVYVADSDNDRIQKFDAGGAYLTQWGANGAGNGQFSNPRGVAIDGSGNVYVVDYNNHRIQKFDGDGTYLTQWGGYGAGNGQFAYPTGVAVDGSGNVYLADYGNNRIQKFNAGGIYQTQWGSVGAGDGQFDLPYGVAVDGSGNVYVADYFNDRIQKFDGDGTYLAQWGGYGAGNGQFDFPIGVAVDGSGNVYVTDYLNDRIQMFDGNGAYLTQWGANGVGDGRFDNPWGVAVDGSGNVYVADTSNHRIQKFGPRVVTLDDGQSHTFASLPPGAYSVTETVPDGWSLDSATCDNMATQDVETVDPASITVADGDAWVCTFTNTQPGSITVTKATNPAGGTGFPFVLNPNDIGFLAEWGAGGAGNGQFHTPYGVAIDGAGNVYVADTYNHRIQKFDARGNFLLAWGWDVVVGGGSGFEVCGPLDTCQAGSYGSGAGQFDYPHDVAIDGGGNVYVSDHNNHRIQKFDGNGAYLTQWGSQGSGNGQFQYPTGVAVDGSGNVYVADTNNHRIQKFDGDGGYLGQWGANGAGDGQFSNPRGVAVDGAGNVYVADTYNHRIQKFDGKGGYLGQWGANGTGNSQFMFPYGVAVDGSGHIYVADTNNQRIQMFDGDGAYLTQWGGFGAGNSQFNFPFGVDVDGSGNVYVADSSNHRIQKFGPTVVTLDDGQSHTFSDLPAGDHTVVELAPDDWTLDDIDCGNATATRDGDAISITLAAGDDVTCTFTNVSIPAELIVTPSYLVSRVAEGATTGDSSMACYWITLPAAPVSGDVVVDVDPGSLLKEVTVNKSQVTLNAANWNNLTTANKTNFVCIRAVDDKIDEPENPLCGDKSADMTGDMGPHTQECGDHLDFIEHTLNTSLTTAPGYGAATPWTNRTLTPLPGRPGSNYLDVLVADNDVAEALITESFAVTDLDESGAPVGKSCYWLTLGSQPVNPVTIAITPDNTEVKTDKTSVTLDAANWNKIDAGLLDKSNMVCVTPIDEPDVDAPLNPPPCVTGSATMLGQPGSGATVCGTHMGSVGHSVSSADPKYNPAPFRNTNGPDFDSDQSTIDALIRDDDVSGFRAQPETLNLKAKTTGTVEVSLTSRPTADVVVSGGAASRTFTPANWNVPQTMVVEAPDTTGSAPETHSLRLSARSADPNYGDLTADDSVRMTVIPESGVLLSAMTNGVAEGGGTATYDLELTSQPTSEVTVTLSTDGQLEVSPQTVTFNATDWDQPKTVEIEAVDDSIAEANTHQGRVTHEVSSADGKYQGSVVGEIVAAITDNDTAGVNLAGAAPVVSEGGQRATYDVVLQSQPTAPVTIAIDGGGQLTATPNVLTFNATNWNKAQTVQVQAIDDRVAEGDHKAALTHWATSDDPFYHGLRETTLTATIRDNDVAGVRVSQAALSLTLGETAGYTVVLTSRPTSAVTIDLAAYGGAMIVNEDCAAAEDGCALLFTPDNWDRPQTVTVQSNGAGWIGYVVGSADGVYQGLRVDSTLINNMFRLFMPMSSRGH